MNHPVIKIIQWVFLLVGVSMFIGALSAGIRMANSGDNDFIPSIIFGLIGIVFAAVGGGFFIFKSWRSKEVAFLRQNGQLVQAEFQRVELNEAITVNGANPFHIICQWHDVMSNEIFIFTSASLWFDPTEFVQGKQIPVYIDLSKPSRYYVDISFLPKARGYV